MMKITISSIVTHENENKNVNVNVNNNKELEGSNNDNFILDIKEKGNIIKI